MCPIIHGSSHVSVPSYCPTWDRRDCPRDSHVSRHTWLVPSVRPVPLSHTGWEGLSWRDIPSVRCGRGRGRSGQEGHPFCPLCEGRGVEEGVDRRDCTLWCPSCPLEIAVCHCPSHPSVPVDRRDCTLWCPSCPLEIAVMVSLLSLGDSSVSLSIPSIPPFQMTGWTAINSPDSHGRGASVPSASPYMASPICPSCLTWDGRDSWCIV